jgi:diguanylate cyclase (GGDEF)-like protein
MSAYSLELVSSDSVANPSRWYVGAMEHLVDVVQSLSMAHDLQSIMDIMRHAARELTGADGATFVLRDDGKCFYAEEDAIAPLWKGLRFPMETCISGWAMMNRQSAVIPDIYVDSRIPADAYRPTFVKSLAMVPIRTRDPIGAIGNYWAEMRQPTPEQMKVLQTLADVTAVALENVEVLNNLEKPVAERTAELEATNNRLKAEVERRRQAEESARRQSITDELTGLYNRRGFFHFATQQLKFACRANETSLLLFADADGLKTVNDCDGHEAGDRLLIGVAKALQRAFGGHDVVGRLGGDEFAVYASGANRSSAELRAALADAVEHVNRTEGMTVSLSVGITRCEPDGAVSFEDHLRLADNAMYVEKQAKRPNRRLDA